ncbi:MAG: hypothetical protein ACI4GO_03430 [Hominenteromicrobium sp.]
MKIKRFAGVLTAVLFCGALLLFCAATVLLPKENVSAAERRKLASFPAFSWESFQSGAYAEGLSDYINDHFALRSGLRAANTAVRTVVFRQPEVGGVTELNGCLFSPQPALDEHAVRQNAEKLQNLIDIWFADRTVYFSVIPDKADFAPEDLPRLDTDAVVSLLCESLGAEYIDIRGTLELADYYRTDTHWRQECLGDTAAALLAGMGLTLSADLSDGTRHTAEPFYGVLWGRYGLPSVAADTLIYCTSPVTESTTVRNLDHPDAVSVYDPETESPDLYDLFLSGASSVIELESPLAQTDRHLVLFRDSFASSLAPWLLTQYGKITMIDIRYISSAKIDAYADLASADDVLFLYSTSILNTGGVLK